MSKVKILLVGAVQENFPTLTKKLESLQSGKAGPFDLCFCMGSIQIPTDLEKPMPLPVYLQEYSQKTPQQEKDDSSDIVSLGNNLFCFHNPKKTDNSPHMCNIQIGDTSLSVALCGRNTRADNNNKGAPQCDLLLSTDWPQGMEEVLQVDTEPLSFDVAEVALQLRPRYHVAPSTQYYHASPPYYIPNSDHVGRFLALAPVTTKKPTKTTKFVHALGLAPLSVTPPPTTAPSTLPCPFLSSNNVNNHGSHNSTPIPSFALQQAAEPAYSRFAGGKQKRSHGDDDNGQSSNSLQPPDDPSVKTLFLYGLHKDVSGELQSTSSSKVLLAFRKYNVEKVRHPPNSATTTYCFLEFPDQDAATKCLLDCQGRVTIDGVELTLKWATTNQRAKRAKMAHNANTVHYVTHDEAPDSITLYFHPTKGAEFTEEYSKALQTYLQKTLEDALNEGNEDDAERVTAETEPALAVQLRTKDSFGFLEFASHAAATMALAAVTTSTDGGFIVKAPENAPKPPEIVVGTTLRWAKGELKKSKREEVLEALGLQRQYHPADSRTDCWFCLASPTCETHLIAGVYNEWYATLPKGPVHPGHVLLVPVEHSHQGAWILGGEWTDLVDKLQRHASEVYGMDLFVFERAMVTKGAYHTHVQCVPVPKDCTTQLQSTMMAHAKASGFDLRPMQSDLSMSSLLSEEDSYFYAEIATGSHKHRFLYKHNADEPSGGASSTVPLQFAREVLAAVLKDPKLAHWKSCVVDKEEETKMTDTFRKSFTLLPSA